MLELNHLQQSICQAFHEMILSYIVNVCALFLIFAFAFHGCLLLQIVFHNPNALEIQGFMFHTP